MRIKLTQSFIDKELTCPEGKKQVEYCCSELAGFYVLCAAVSPGIGTYYLRYKINGKTTHKKIGRTNDISLKDARDRAKLLKLEINQGKDPQAETKQKGMK